MNYGSRVPGWEGLYEVSDRSNVRSLRTGKLLKPKQVGYGNNAYLRVCFCREGGKTYRLAHRIMWEAFNGPVPEDLHVLHGAAQDEERHHLSNLSLGTHAKNMGEDRRRDGTDNRGSKHAAAKLDEEAVLIIRATPRGYGTGRKLAQRFGVSESVISTVRSGNAWEHAAATVAENR